MRSLPPPEWGGPGGYWAPETLLLAALGDCTTMTFRAIAKASRFEWRELSADVEGKLERIDGNGRFTEITIRVRLVVPPGTDAARARQLLEKSEKGCPVSNSPHGHEAPRGRDRRGGVSAIVRQLGRVGYEPAWRAMQAFTDARDEETPDELWFLEHEPVFTQGLNGKAEHLLAPGDIPVVGIDRGGQVTYHGPGQLVMYALVDLRRLRIGVRELVVALENAVVALAAQHGIVAAGRREAPGVYVGERKLASIGLRVRRGCSYHGLALNVDMDLEPFGRINPCGMAGLAMTHLALEGARADLADSAQALAPLAVAALGLEWDGTWGGCRPRCVRARRARRRCRSGPGRSGRAARGSLRGSCR